MDCLYGLSRNQLGCLCLSTLTLLYYLGPLEFILRFVPGLLSLPALLVLAEILRRYVESVLGQKTVSSEGKVVLITGCDTGFGNILAKRLADKGFQVVAGCYDPTQQGAEELSTYSGNKIHVIKMDVTSDESMAKSVEAVNLKLNGKGLWAVVANAGIAIMGPLEWCNMKDIEDVFNVNTFGVIRTVKCFLPHVRKTKGRVVVTASMTSTISNPYIIPYSMSKAAVKSLVQGLQRELVSFGVYFSSIEPNYYATNIVKNMNFDSFTNKYSILDDAMKKDYEGFLETCKKHHDSVEQVVTSTNIEEPIAAFEHAVTSQRPRPYYFVDNKAFEIAREIMMHFNVEVTDTIVHSVQYLAQIKKLFGRTATDC